MAARVDPLTRLVADDPANLGHLIWRLHNLYWIVDKYGKKVRFRPNAAQLKLLEEAHFLNIILKARQMGFSTFIDILALDQALFNDNFKASIITYTKELVGKLFEEKVKFPYDHLPEQILQARPSITRNKNQLVFANYSSVEVTTSGRGGTNNLVHISEFGKMCAKFPDKAREVVTGTLNTIAPGQMVFIESTAEGREGRFFDMTQAARKLADAGTPLTPLDYKFHFFPWYQDPAYRIDPAGVVITKEDAEYFEQLRIDHGIELDAEQKAWYVKKAEEQGDDMRREYPSTPDEAFEQAIEGAYFARQMADVRREGRICAVPYDARLPVYTFWDLGMNDQTTIWFMQRLGLANRFIHYYSNNGEGLQHYVKYLRSLPYIYGEAYLPHDVEVAELGNDGKTRREVLESLGVKVRTVARPLDKGEAIQAMRDMIPTCWFDEVGCAEGIKCLDHYRKEWDERLGAFKNTPLHDWASHGADGFQTFAIGFEPNAGGGRIKRTGNWRTR